MKIFIYGAGKMGAWLTEELCTDHEVAVYDKDPKKLKFFFSVSRISSFEEVKDFNPELLINCVDLHCAKDAFAEVLPFLDKKCILSDIMSVKGDIENFYKESAHPYASVHPMFGPTFANLKNLENENGIIIKESCEEGKKFFRTLFEKIKLNIFEFTFKDHDLEMAYSLSTPFTSSLVFAACLEKTDVPGTTFRKHYDIAKKLLSEDDNLLVDILCNPNTLNQIERINNQLNYLRHIIMGRDLEEMTTFLDKLRKNF